ncbi:GNAT family N-acetyltransferase [Actinomadura sp. 6N118]|uniref:GNAT family N-acetyltransferase n=1 Tax=Actinomadura sp. 6N118 TaxID=3375151 RepID=UPI0037AB8173
MTDDRQDLVLTHHASEAARPLLDALCEVYADAYGVEPLAEKTSAFRGRAERGLGYAGFELVTAWAGGALVGFAFGYSIPEGNTRWWQGLQPEPPAGFTVETGTRTFILTEIEIRQSWQSQGIGKRIHDELLSGRLEERATLATNPTAAKAQALYEAWGWERIGQRPGMSTDYFDAYDLFLRSLGKERPR